MTHAYIVLNIPATMSCLASLSVKHTIKYSMHGTREIINAGRMLTPKMATQACAIAKIIVAGPSTLDISISSSKAI